MEFKQNPKMKSEIACFKEGGQVYKSRTHKEDPKELAEDKAIAKKAVSQHEAAKHKGEEKTELKLKGGRRVAKAKGTVNKFKKGGAVDAAEKGKPSGDKDKTKKVKEAPKKAATPSKAKTKKPEVPGTDIGASGDLSALMAPPAAGPAAAAPSAAMSMPTDGMQNMASGRRPWINEEPDDATAPVKKPVRRPKPKGYEDEMGVEGFADGGPSFGSMTDRERALMAAAMSAVGPQPARQLSNATLRAGTSGLGNAINTGPLGAAGAMGAPRNTPLSPQEQDIMRGLQAVGGYCKGGKAY